MKNEDWRQKTEVWKTEDGRTQNPPVRRSFSVGGKPEKKRGTNIRNYFPLFVPRLDFIIRNIISLLQNQHRLLHHHLMIVAD